jgi:mono/diheme cytochrome c family protein
MKRHFVGMCAMLWAGHVAADGLPGVSDAARAQVNYMLHCRGCHGPDGAGSADGTTVPRMNGFVGNFLKVVGGREFLVRVPGSANAPLSDIELAELLNWMLPTLSGSEMPTDFAPYSGEEVARLRARPVSDPADVRSRLVAQIKGESGGEDVLVDGKTVDDTSTGE